MEFCQCFVTEVDIKTRTVSCKYCVTAALRQ